MESENLLSLAEAHWRAIEKLSDALAETADLQADIRIGLDLLLAALDRPGAALDLPR